MLNDLYETHYGIFNHSNNKSSQVNYRPLASVAMHDGEEIISNDLMEEFVRAYVSKGIGTLYNISLPEFLSYPKHVVNMLFRLADEEQSKKARLLSEVQKDFDSNR